jgi:D-tyrosyl-tRNA(Tyr) deacylase
MRAVASRVLSASVTVNDGGAEVRPGRGADVTAARSGGGAPGIHSEQSGTVEGTVVGAIDEPGLLVLLGVTHTDTADTARAMAAKLHELRILRDEQSCASAGAPLLVVSQFTLYGRTGKGRRPSWTDAAPGSVAEPLIDEVVAELRRRGARVQTGRFGAPMAVTSINDGPFTVIVEL